MSTEFDFYVHLETTLEPVFDQRIIDQLEPGLVKTLVQLNLLKDINLRQMSCHRCDQDENCAALDVGYDKRVRKYYYYCPTGRIKEPVWLSAEAARGYQWDFRQFRTLVARELDLSEPETEETGLTYHPIGTGELGPNRVFVTYVTGLTSYNFRIRLNHLREQLPNRRLVVFTPSFEVHNSSDHEILARQQIQLISLRDILTDKGLNLGKLKKGAGEGEPAETPHFPTPRGTTWADIRIRFISPEAVRITAGAVAHVYTFSEMGFSDNRKGGLPDKYWEVLHELARHKGALTWEAGSDLPAPQKVIPELRTRLQSFLGLTGDPFYAYKDVRSYKSRFQISEV